MDQDRKEELKKFFYRKRIIIPIIFFLFVGAYFIFRADPKLAKITLQKVERIDLKQTVLATGQVVSQTDLDLSFNASGTVRELYVKVGDKVKKGQILAKLDAGVAGASLTSARGGLASAQAKLRKILEGSSNEEVALAQVTFDQTKKTQDILVKNAYENLLNSTPEAVPADGKADYTAPTISGFYSLGREGVLKIHSYYSTSGTSFSVDGLAVGTAVGNTVTAQPIGNSGLFIKFSSTSSINNDDWIINIPNKKASNYLTNYNAYQQALSQRDLLVAQAQAQLDIKRAQARPSDVQLAQADVMVAEGQVEQAYAKYQDTVITAPADGTITSIDLKLGELSEIQKKVITLQDISNLYVEAKINESSIANLKIGQAVSMTLDAFGPDKLFVGSIIQIDPSATTGDGIVNYKIKSSIDSLNNPAILSGMNANISILTSQKSGVLVIPRVAVTTKENKSYVNLITNTKKKKYKEQEVQTGLQGDGNMIEVVQGLSVDDQVALLSK